MSESYFHDEFSLAAYTTASSAIPVPYDIESRSELSSCAPVSFYEHDDDAASIVSTSIETTFTFHQIWNGGGSVRSGRPGHCSGTHAASFRTNLSNIEEASNSDVSSSNSLESSRESRYDAMMSKGSTATKETELEREGEDSSYCGGLEKVGSSKENEFAICCNYIQIGEYETALSKFHQLLTSQPKDPSPKLASIYHNLGILHSKLGSLDESIKSFHKSILIHNQCPAGHGLADTYIQLGFLHLEKTKSYRKSVQAFHEALRIREALFGTQHPLTGKIHNNLGVAYLIRRKFEEANKHFQESLQIQQFRLSQLHKETITKETKKYIELAWLEIANILCNVGAMVTEFHDVRHTCTDLTVASQAIRNALRIRIELSDGNHSFVERMQASLAVIRELRKQGVENAGDGLFSTSDAMFYSQFFMDDKATVPGQGNKSPPTGNKEPIHQKVNDQTPQTRNIHPKIRDQVPQIPINQDHWV